MQPIIRSYEASVDDVKPGERSVIAKIGGRAVDRHRTIIDPGGIDLAAYRSNPVVLWEHGRDPARGMKPVGKNKWIRADGGQLIAKTVFWDDEYSRELFRAYQDGDLKGWSVNVLAHEASPPTREEIRATPELDGHCDLIYRRTELAEYSAVAIPSHRDALSILASRGIWIPEEARATPPPTPAVAKAADDEDEDDDEEPVERHVVEEGGKWYVLSEDKSKRLGGPYSSKEEADKRLQEVEYFKHHKPEGRSLVEIAREVAEDRRAMQRAIRDEIVALVDLMVYGRV